MPVRWACDASVKANWVNVPIRADQHGPDEGALEVEGGGLGGGLVGEVGKAGGEPGVHLGQAEGATQREHAEGPEGMGITRGSA